VTLLADRGDATASLAVGALILVALLLSAVILWSHRRR
jgi:hypothetical protein